MQRQTMGYQSGQQQCFEPFPYLGSGQYGRFGHLQRLLTIRFATLRQYQMMFQMAFQSSNGCTHRFQ